MACQAADLWAATESASVKADSAVQLDLGNYGTVRQLHVVHADDVEVDHEALAALGLTEG